jgi:UDP-N-acetylglucosamine 1-carboxyvinyltransferase
MSRFLIEGGYRVSGDMTPSGNKNEALPALAACLLTEEEVLLENVPRIQDVEVMVRILEALGVETEWQERHRLRLQAREVRGTALDRDLCRQVRASVLFAGPMVARWGT